MMRSSYRKIPTVLALFGTAFLGLAASTASADVCDLTAGKDLSCALGSAIYENPSNLTNVGSGLISPFLTVQNSPTESGYTTDITKVADLPLDAKRNNANMFTNTFALGSLGTVTIGSTTYFQFFLDVNETNSANERNITLDYLRIYSSGSSSPFLKDKNTTPTLGDLDTLLGSAKYDLGANSVILNYDLFQGSGLGYDMDLLVDVSLFSGIDPTTRLVFASGFSGTSDGFEEWAFLKCTDTAGCIPPPPPPQCDPECPPLPEPGTLPLIGLSLIGLAVARRRYWV